MRERTVGRTCSQNEQHQVGQDNIRMDTQRTKEVNPKGDGETTSRKLVTVNG